MPDDVGWTTKKDSAGIPSDVSHAQRQLAVSRFLAALDIDVPRVCGINADYIRGEITVTQQVVNDDGAKLVRGVSLVTVTHRVEVK